MKPVLSFFVSGEPKAQPRARAIGGKGKPIIYNPKTASLWKDMIYLEAKSRTFKTFGVFPLADPVCINTTFYLTSKKRGRWHHSKPDRDNLDKAVLDALVNAGILFDDRYVADGTIKKLHADALHPPGAAIEIFLLEETDL